MAYQIGTGLATVAAPSGALSVSTNEIGNVTTGEDTLHTYTMPANTLVETNRYVHIRDLGTVANSIHAKTFKLYFGNTVILAVSFNVSTTYSWIVEAWVVRTGTDTQYYFAEMRANIGTTPVGFVSEGDIAEPETAAIIIKDTAEGVASNDIRCRAFSVEYF